MLPQLKIPRASEPPDPAPPPPILPRELADKLWPLLTTNRTEPLVWGPLVGTVNHGGLTRTTIPNVDVSGVHVRLSIEVCVQRHDEWEPLNVPLSLWDDHMWRSAVTSVQQRVDKVCQQEGIHLFDKAVSVSLIPRMVSPGIPAVDKNLWVRKWIFNVYDVSSWTLQMASVFTSIVCDVVVENLNTLGRKSRTPTEDALDVPCFYASSNYPSTTLPDALTTGWTIHKTMCQSKSANLMREQTLRGLTGETRYIGEVTAER